MNSKTPLLLPLSLCTLTYAYAQSPQGQASTIAPRVDSDGIVVPVLIVHPDCTDAVMQSSYLLKKFQGTTVLKIVINTDGSIKEVSVEKASGNKKIDETTVKCVQGWRYQPATKDGIAVEYIGHPSFVWNFNFN